MFIILTIQYLHQMGSCEYKKEGIDFTNIMIEHESVPVCNQLRCEPEVIGVWSVIWQVLIHTDTYPRVIAALKRNLI